MFIQCPKCSNQIIEGVVVCPYCGARQGSKGFNNTEERDPYEILQVSPNAEQEVIKAAYRRLARKYHPDSSDTPSEQKMKELNWAYDTLGDSKKRKEWESGGKSSGLGKESKKQKTRKSNVDEKDPFDSWTWDDKEKTEEPLGKNKNKQSKSSTPSKRSKTTGKIDKTSLRQAGILGLVALLMIIFPAILGSVIDYNGNSDSRVSSNQTEKEVSTDIPSYINSPSPTITPTQIQKIIYPNSSMECMHWGEINRTYLREIVCVYGRVRIVGGEEFFTVHFSYSPSDLRLMDVNGFYWPDIEEGHCIVTKGEIRDNVKYLFLSPFVNKEPTEIYEIDNSFCE